MEAEAFATRRYRYRSHVRSMSKIMGWIGVILCVGMSLVMVVTQAWFMSFMIAIIAIEFLFISWFTRRFAVAEVALTADAVEYTSRRGTLRIPYAEVESIVSKSIPYFGGWVKVIGPQGKARITVTLEGITDFLGELRRRVDRMNPEATYSRQKLFAFYKTATYSEQSWSRLSGMGKWAGIVMVALGMAPQIAFDVAGWWAAVPVTSGLVVYVLSEIVLSRYIATHSDPVHFTTPPRNRDLERKVYRIAAAFWFVAVGAAALALLA